MKFCLIGPGLMEIPPLGWGAIEIIIWDYKFYLEKLGHQVKIINSRDRNFILQEINSYNSDVCHCHFEDYIDILIDCNSRLKLMTSHCGEIRSELGLTEYTKHFKQNIFPKLNSIYFYNFCLDSYIKNLYVSSGFDLERQKIVPNAARKDLIKFNETPLSNDTICVGTIQCRKRQYLLKHSNVFFVGKIVDGSVESNNKRWLGEWTKEDLYNKLTNNANLVLLSESEGASLVLLEAMMAGLGLVISEGCTANLDITLPFIDVIPEKYIMDNEYISFIIEKNKRTSIAMRHEIRTYAEKNHSYEVIIEKYLNTIKSIIF